MPKNFWHQKAPIIVLVVGVALMTAAVWWQAGQRTPTNRAVSTSQARANDSPRGLTDSGASSNLSRSGRTVKVDPDHAEGHRKQIPAQVLQAELISELAQLERMFQSEPISATWSGNTQRMIETALSEESLAAKEAPVPIAHEAECRTFSCRIRVSYRNEMDAQMGEVFLLGDIAGKLPSAQFGRLVGADGTIQIVMYANTGRAGGRN